MARGSIGAGGGAGDVDVLFFASGLDAYHTLYIISMRQSNGSNASELLLHSPREHVFFVIQCCDFR